MRYQCLSRIDSFDLRDNVFKDSLWVPVKNFSYFIVLQDLRANCVSTNKSNWFVGGSCGGWCRWLAVGVENTSTGLSHRTRCVKQGQLPSLSWDLITWLLFIVCDSQTNVWTSPSLMVIWLKGLSTKISSKCLKKVSDWWGRSDRQIVYQLLTLCLFTPPQATLTWTPPAFALLSLYSISVSAAGWGRSLRNGGELSPQPHT